MQENFMNKIFSTYTVAIKLKLMLILGVICGFFSITKQFSDTSCVSYNSAQFQHQRYCQIPRLGALSHKTACISDVNIKSRCSVLLTDWLQSQFPGTPPLV